MRKGRLLALVFLVFWVFKIEALPMSMKRTILGIYNNQPNSILEYSDLFQFAVTPLEHLGAKVVFVDGGKELPFLDEQDDVRGILIWNVQAFDAVAAEVLLDWILLAMDKGKKIFLVGHPPWDRVTPHRSNKEKMALFWEKIGLKREGRWVLEPYDVTVVQEKENLFDFEKSFQGKLPPFEIITTVSDDVENILSAHQESFRGAGERSYLSSLITRNSKGAYATPGYLIFLQAVERRFFRKWYVNPFELFNLVFDLASLPKADATTLCGKRIYYSQIDGDGWNNYSEVKKKEGGFIYSADIIYNEILKAFPHLPVTVAPIMADLDPEWVGSVESQEIAKKIFALANVEAGSHTYSHPFDWAFFENYTPEKEIPYLSRYPFGNWRDRSLFASFWRWMGVSSGFRKQIATDFRYPLVSLDAGYETPRGYANQPFDLEKEIIGSYEKISALLPPGKKVKILQWSGDAMPFAAAIRMTKSVPLANINGGGTRFDSEFDSYAWVSPLSREVQGLRQPYSSMSNENEYTSLWTAKFYAFNQLPITWKTTELPYRIRPMNLYYHIYSGEKIASLAAIKDNLAFATRSEIIPIHADEYSRIVESFYQISFLGNPDNNLRIIGRDKIQTIRFDNVVFTGVDFSSSKGIMGQRHLHGSLYVHLDPTIEEPVISLKSIPVADREPVEHLPYLIASSYQIERLTRINEGNWKAKLHGVGPLNQQWSVPKAGKYRVVLLEKEEKTVGTVESVAGLLELSFNFQSRKEGEIEFQRIQD
jgi:hypothetical protein